MKAKRDITELIISRARSGDTVVISTGDLVDLTAICDRAVVMRGGRVAGAVDAVDENGQISWSAERLERLKALAVR